MEMISNKTIRKDCDKSREEILCPELVSSLKIIYGDLRIKHELLNTDLNCNPNERNLRNSSMNFEYNYRKDLYNECEKNKDIEGMWEMITRPFVMSWFIKNYKQIYKYVGEEKYYEMLGYTITDIDYEDYINQYDKLISIGKNPLNMMTNEDREDYEKLPEKMTIYRGCSTKQKNITTSVLKGLNGPSWTIDKKIGQWFSERFCSGSQPIIMSYEISKSEVQSYFTGRKESEVFLDYKKMDLTKIKWVFTDPTYERLFSKF